MPRSSGNSPHIPDTDLIQFADGELAVKAVTAAETHLRTCSKCRVRLDELKHGSDAYNRYHAQVLRSSLELPQEWSAVAARLRTLETPRNRLFPTILWATAAALACGCLVITWFLYREAPTRRMQEVSARAALVRIPPLHKLQVTASGHTWYRAATLEGKSERLTAGEGGLEETRALFVKANYSWDDPLSARSFAAWRRHLPSKRDQVLSIQDADGKNRFYRLQTDTPTGVLHMATLTLRADTLSPVRGVFHFERENHVTIQDAGEMPQRAEKLKAKNDQFLPRRARIREVGPREELRVFAALDAIGADVGESVTVELAPSKQQIIVEGLGLSSDREQQIRTALAPIPNTDARFRSRQATGLMSRSTASATSPPVSGDVPLRHTLEERAGGAQQFQAIADKALDASSTILQRAHALYVLAEKFSPPVAAQFGQPERETLRSLRRRHAIVVEQATAELRGALLPLLDTTPAADETQTQPDTSWQVGAIQLYEQAKLLDASLGRVLAGTYSQDTGQSIWNRLPDEIRRLEALAVSQENER